MWPEISLCCYHLGQICRKERKFCQDLKVKCIVKTYLVTSQCHCEVFSPMFHPAGITLWVQQARCCRDIYLIQSKALHGAPGLDRILRTNFIIATPLTSGRYTNNEFGSSYTKWSLTSFVSSLPFNPPPLLPPAITLWVCLHHILQTATSKLCLRSNLTEAMWLHWHQAWANNPSWEGFFFGE